MRRRRTLLSWSILAALCVLALPGTAAAGDDEMDPVVEATLHLKVQSYDRKLTGRIGKRYVVAILYQSGASASAARKMSDAFTHVAEKYRIRSVTPTVVMIAVDAKLGDALKAAGANMIYVTAGLEAAIPQIKAAGVALQASTVSHVRDHVVAGIAVGIVVDQRKPKIVVNLKAAQAVGMDLDAEMLGFAEVIR